MTMTALPTVAAIMSVDEQTLAEASFQTAASPGMDGAKASVVRRSYLRLLALAFALFSSVRIFTYLPTIWTIHSSGDSSQYSLWTWVTWIGANGTMAAWLYENNYQRVNSAIAVSTANALMCLATCLTIVYFRF